MIVDAKYVFQRLGPPIMKIRGTVGKTAQRRRIELLVATLAVVQSDVVNLRVGVRGRRVTGGAPERDEILLAARDSRRVSSLPLCHRRRLKRHEKGVQRGDVTLVRR